MSKPMRRADGPYEDQGAPATAFGKNHILLSANSRFTVGRCQAERQFDENHPSFSTLGLQNRFFEFDMIIGLYVVQEIGQDPASLRSQNNFAVRLQRVLKETGQRFEVLFLVDHFRSHQEVEFAVQIRPVPVQALHGKLRQGIDVGIGPGKFQGVRVILGQRDVVAAAAAAMLTKPRPAPISISRLPGLIGLCAR